MPKTQTPALRFQGFTDEWEQKKLGDLGTITTGNTPSTAVADYYSEDGLLWVTPTDITGGIIYNSERKLSKSGQAVARIVPKNTILVTCIASIGKNTMLGSTGSFNQQINGLTPDEKNYDPYFLFTESTLWSAQMKHSAAAGTMQIVNRTEFSNLKTMVPSIEEQQKIGDFFKQLDALISLHQRKYTKLVNTKKSMLEKMFPKNGANVPEIRFAGFTGEWERRKLGEIVDVRSGRDYKHLQEGEIPVYGTGGYMLSVNEALSYTEDAIGIGRKGTIDKPYILRAPFWTVDTLFYAVPRNKFDLNFVFDIFQKVDWKKKDESTGVPSLSKTTINDVDVLMPNIEEQQKIGDFFASLDELIGLQLREVEKLRRVKKSCLEKMFV